MRQNQFYSLFSGFWLLLLSVSSSFAVENGTDANDTLPAIFGISMPSKSGICSAFLVNPSLLLTAAHCLKTLDADSKITNAPDLNRDGKKYKSRYIQADFDFKKATAHPGFLAITDQMIHDDPSNSLKRSRYDIAFIPLKTPITSVTTYPILDITLEPVLNDVFLKPIKTTGYGVTRYLGPEGDYSDSDQGTKRFSEQVIVSGVQFNLIRMDSSAGSILPGDSGGPVLFNRNGTWTVIGVNQSNNPGANTYSIAYSLAVAFRPEIVSWIEKTAGIQLNKTP